MTAAEDTLRAISAGEVDAFVVSDGGSGQRVFALSTADRPYRIFVESMRDGAATLSASGLILYANRRFAELLSRSREAIVGVPLARFVAGGLPVELKEILAHGALSRTVELELVNADGFTIPVLVGASPLDVDGDRLTCLTFTDLSAQKAQEREIARLTHAQAKQVAEVREEFALNLAESQKLEALGVLAGGIAHDFNNLLTVILGNIDLALGTLAPDARERSQLERAELAATRSAELARQMLAYSGKGRFVVEIVDLREIVSGQTELIKAAVSKKADLSLDLAPDTPPIEADATQLRQVMLNLITNASEAIGDANGTIDVRCGPIDADRAFLSEYDFAGALPDGKYAFFEVADTGTGMDAKTKEKIFDPFFTTKFTGRGLGLAAVQGIVRGHGGAMKVNTERGEGTTFTLIFPVSTKSAPAPSHIVTSPIGHATGTVLVAEDDDAVRRMTVTMLESIGLTVVSAVDGAQALSVLKQRGNEFAFVLLDFMMPGMSGDEVIDELQRVGATTPIVLTSGYNAHELSQRFVGRGVAAFLQKPYQLQQLRATALELLAAQVQG
jgi:two-component system cell cycle sensor histidine kinase/response regulator CckA